MTEPLVDVTGARRRRARARLRRRLAIVGIVAGVLALVGGGWWVVQSSPLLAAHEVQVTGNALITTDEIIATAAVPLGAPLVAIDTEAIRGRIMGALPAIADAQVTRSWPSTLRLQVTEWVPSVVVELPSSWMWISAEGESFHQTPERPQGVLVARGNLENDDVLTTVAAVAQSLPPSVREQADSIEAGSVDSVTIALSDGRRIVWGSADDAELKGDVIVPLLRVQAKVYDVSAPTHPTTR